MKIFGAGIDVTLLRLQGAAMDNNPYGYAAISDPYDIYHDGFEASDFTIDCNIAAQPSQLVTCDAVVVNGTHNRLRRLRVINFGAQTISPIQVQCFPLYLGTYQLPINQPAVSGVADVIEDCIVEQPGLRMRWRPAAYLWLPASWAGNYALWPGRRHPQLLGELRGTGKTR